VIEIEARHPPQAWVDRRRRVLVGEKPVRWKVPERRALGVADYAFGQRADEAAARFVEIRGVAERKKRG